MWLHLQQPTKYISRSSAEGVVKSWQEVEEGTDTKIQYQETALPKLGRKKRRQKVLTGKQVI